MSYLWMRKWRILITDENDQKALDVSELHCTFTVKKRRAQGGSTAIVRIHNLANDTEQSIIKEGDRIVIEAGYEGVANSQDGNNAPAVRQYGTIFDGKIIYPSRSKDSNTDFVLTLSCIDGNDPLFMNYISMSVNKGMNQRQVFETACSGGAIPIQTDHITEKLRQQTLPRGKVFFGMPIDYVEDVCRGNAATFFMDGGKLNLYTLLDVAEDEALEVDPYTGLIGMPQQTVDGLNFRLLLNPAIKLMTRVKLSRSELNEVVLMPKQKQRRLDDEWIYQAIEVTHTGDTRGNDWYTDVVGISRYGKDSMPGMLASMAQTGNQP